MKFLLVLALVALARAQDNVCIYAAESVETGPHNHLAPVACGVPGSAAENCQIFLQAYTIVEHTFRGNQANVYGDIIDIDKNAAVDGKVFVPSPPDNVQYVGDAIPQLDTEAAGQFIPWFPNGPAGALVTADPGPPSSIEILTVHKKFTIGRDPTFGSAAFNTRDWAEITVQQRATLTLEAPPTYFGANDVLQFTTNSFEMENEATLEVAGDLPVIDNKVFEIWADVDVELGHRIRIEGAGDNIYLSIRVRNGGGDILLKNDSMQEEGVDNLAVWLDNQTTAGEVVIGHDHVITGCVQSRGYLVLHSKVTITGSNNGPQA